ncbi:prepilin peptidase [Anaerococcus urinomassiliensis]|uniref:prepilin peptidase n=1 Tax=Anaerococcus urinomassiliensis TaxID=1745712 RepID=UPI001F197CE6|nr:A24 family peptidase [Anaerococcus urinomassiliensis]
MFFYYMLIFAIGSIFASFANLVVLRTIRGESIVYPPSHCDSCGHKLKAVDLFPIISYIFLRGKCRYCKSKIPIESFMVELILGILLVVIFDFTNILGSILIFSGLMFALIIALIDLKTYDIYMNQVAILAIMGIIYRYMSIGFDIKFFYIILGFSISYLLIYLISKKGIGDGDIYFYLALFLFIENEYIGRFVLISIWIGAIYGVFVFLKHKSVKIEIPFCIFIFMAFLLIVLFRGYPI